MADSGHFRLAIERAVSQRLSNHVERFRSDLVDQILREIEPLIAQPEPPPAAAQPDASAVTATLSTAFGAIHRSAAQSDILNALLDGCANFAARVALFVVRSETLAGWQARGFNDNNVRGVGLDASKGSAARAIQLRQHLSAPAHDFDAAFLQQHGAPANGASTLFPLVVKDKVAALLYCDSGAGNANADNSAIALLTSYTCLWLEHAATKKPSASGAEAHHGAVAAGPEPSPEAAPAAVPTPAAAPVRAGEPTIDHLPAEEQELHKKARRFAKLLVDEIKLYNQAKVSEGRQNRNMYKLLREDIEKSRATYDKRYSSTPVASANYFNAEVVRILADNDASLLGSDFPG